MNVQQRSKLGWVGVSWGSKIAPRLFEAGDLLNLCFNITAMTRTP